MLHLYKYDRQYIRWTILCTWNLNMHYNLKYSVYEHLRLTHIYIIFIYLRIYNIHISLLRGIPNCASYQTLYKCILYALTHRVPENSDLPNFWLLFGNMDDRVFFIYNVRFLNVYLCVCVCLCQLNEICVGNFARFYFYFNCFILIKKFINFF